MDRMGLYFPFNGGLLVHLLAKYVQITNINYDSEITEQYYTGTKYPLSLITAYAYPLCKNCETGKDLDINQFEA